jgi:hypothetical protein
VEETYRFDEDSYRRDDQYLAVGARELDADEAKAVRRLLDQGGS